MPKIKLNLDIGLVGCRRSDTIDTNKDLGYTDDEWEAESQKHKEAAIEEYMEEWVWNYVSLWWEEL